MYKILRLFSIFTLIIFNLNLVYAEDLKIAYVDIDKILSQSKVGMKINSKMENMIEKKNKEFQKIEEDLKKQDSEIVKQKNILSKEELNKKISNIQKELNDYRVAKEKFNKEINQKRLKATGDLVVYLNKILGKHASDNSISLIIQKKNIVIGKSELDITKPILEIFNKEVKDVKLN